MELIKRDDRWDLYNEDGHKIASTLDGCVNNLSLKNCQAIERGYDLDELVQKYLTLFPSGYSDPDRELVRMGIKSGFKEGFQKALSILGDKKFSINEVIELCKILMSNPFEKCGKTYQELTDNYIQSLQQTEWNVEIEMDIIYGIFDYKKLREKPKLDADCNLILKRK